jgi:GTPase SAR1 family protein
MNTDVVINTIMIGPEGSGKTVLAAVLADFVDRNPDLGLRIKSVTFDTKKYFKEVISVMRRGEWPPSTRQGEPQALDWHWGAFGEWYPAGLQDPAGQDIRAELTGQSSALGIVERIRQANLLMLVVDVYGHQSATDSQRQENGWIVENILQLCDPERTSLIIVATKADRFIHELPRDQFGNREAVLRTIASRMPEANLEQYGEVLNHPCCAAVAVAATEAEVEYTASGQTLKPAHGLRSLGMPGLVDKIVAAIGFERQRVRDAEAERVHREEEEHGKKRVELAWKCVAATVVAIVGMFLMSSVLEGCKACWATCTTCEGRGEIKRRYTIDTEFVPCKRCDGKGRERIPCP